MKKEPTVLTTSIGNPVTTGPRGPLIITREIAQRLRPGALKTNFLAARS